MSQRLTTHKRVLHAGFAELASADADQMGAVLGALYHPDAEFRGSHPINELSRHPGDARKGLASPKTRTA